LVFKSLAISESAAAQWGLGAAKFCCCSRKGGSRDMVSPHDGDGELHLAFAIAADELTSWEAWLAENGIAVEETRTWEFGGHSFISGIQTGTSSRLLHRESGQFIDAVAPSDSR
jgi:hypothetical protein